MRRSGSSRPDLAGCLLAGLLVALEVAGCGSPPPTGSGPIDSLAGAGTLSTAAPGSALASRTAPTVGVTSPGQASAPGVALDPTLLSILPPAIAGVPVTAEPSSFADATADPDFVASVEAAAFAIAVDGSDLVSGVVARLRPGVYSDAFFRDWRDSYNDGACSQAGGVVGTAEAELSGRTVYVTSCAGGLLVYHAYLPGRDVVVSLFSLGDRRFGEQLMNDLRP